MTVEAAIYELLTGSAEVSALVGTRVYPITLPETPTLPAVTYQRVDTLHVTSHSGPSGLEGPLFQFTAWASSAQGARAVRDAVRRAVHGFRGIAAGLRVAGLAEGGSDGYSAEPGYFQAFVDVRVWWEEEAA